MNKLETLESSTRFAVVKAIEKGFKARTISTIFTLDYLIGKKANFNLNEQCYSNLLSEIVWWLRTEHNIHLRIDPVFYSRLDTNPEYTGVYVLGNYTGRTPEPESTEDDYYETYEVAVAAGILEIMEDKHSFI